MVRQSGMSDREPCPWRIVDDVGGAFCMGAIGGGIWHAIKGARMAPAGARLAGSLSAVSARSPVLGGQFAVWGGLFACCDCTLTSIRQKEDPWNSIISGAATGGLLSARAGPKAMLPAAVVGGVLLALIEGLGIAFSRMMAQPTPTKEDMLQAARADPTAPPTAGGLFPSGFGGGFRSSPNPSTDEPTLGRDTGMPSPTSEPFMETDGTTTYITEPTRQEESSTGRGFWPFGGGK
jgi:import inner membrane translocase subunit TIM17